jgi:hypothetical protein
VVDPGTSLGQWPLSHVRMSASESLDCPERVDGSGQWSMRILGHAPRPGPRNRHDFRNLLPAVQHRILCASAANVAERPATRTSASGSIWRDAPHGQVTRTRKSPKQSSSRLMWGSTRTRAWAHGAKPCRARLFSAGYFRGLYAALRSHQVHQEGQDA